MVSMEQGLHRFGYCVLNIDYPSRSAAITQLADAVIPPAIAKCRSNGATTIHFVTHSMGGILVRDYLARHNVQDLGRVVMIGPPNQGSEVVDRLGRLWLFEAINGPAGRELGTQPSSTPNRLGPVNFPLGVIAGDRSINLINSIFIRGRNDGKVSVTKTKVDGLADHVIIAATHPFIVRNRATLHQTVHFLRTGAFDHSHSPN